LKVGIHTLIVGSLLAVGGLFNYHIASLLSSQKPQWRRDTVANYRATTVAANCYAGSAGWHVAMRNVIIGFQKQEESAERAAGAFTVADRWPPVLSEDGN